MPAQLQLFTRTYSHFITRFFALVKGLFKLVSCRLVTMRRRTVFSLAPFLILASFCFVYTNLSRPSLRGAMRRLNIIYHAEVVRQNFFGLYRHRIQPSQIGLEADWRKRFNQKGCDRLSEISNGSATVKPLARRPYKAASGFLLNHLPPGAVKAEASLLVDLQRWGHAPSSGGWYRPKGCSPKEVVAIVIPYRDRHENLVNFLAYMHAFLQRQRRHYVVVVVEQVNQRVRFNRAKLFNTAVKEIMQEMAEVECIVFHDVDKLPFHLFNLYACGEQPRQLATMAWNVTGGRWRDYYEYFFGGVTAFARWQLLRMNGLSNVFYGWGGEDDDTLGRSLLAGYQPMFPSKYVGRMWVMEHHHDLQYIPNRVAMLRMDKVLTRMMKDGLHEVKYQVKYRLKRPLYTVFGVVV